MFDSLNRPSPRALIFVIQGVSLLTTAWFVWSLSLVPRLRHETLASIVWHALLFALLAWIWSAAIACVLYLVIPAPERTDMKADVTAVASTAVWFGPAMILLSQFSPAAVFAAVILSIQVARMIYAQVARERASHAPEPVPDSPPDGLFASAQLPQPKLWRELAPALAISFCLEAAAISVMAHYPLLGAAWICMAAALLTVCSLARGAARPAPPASLPRSLWGVLATVVMATVLTIAGTHTHGGGGDHAWGVTEPGGTLRPGPVDSARILLRQLLYGDVPQPPQGNSSQGETVQAPFDDTGAVGGYPGIILWPEIKPYTTLIAPPVARTSIYGHGVPQQPLSIPFSGEYWMYRWPFVKPPTHSYFKRGSPTGISFRTTDSAPLKMEAHHKLDTPISIDCCSYVRVEVSNADSYPHSVQVGLALVDNSGPRRRSVVLGSQFVTSRPDLKQDPVRPVQEILDFEIPSTTTLAQFDELEVIYTPERFRADKSAKIAVERFILVPR